MVTVVFSVSSRSSEVITECVALLTAHKQTNRAATWRDTQGPLNQSEQGNVEEEGLTQQPQRSTHGFNRTMRAARDSQSGSLEVQGHL